MKRQVVHVEGSTIVDEGDEHFIALENANGEPDIAAVKTLLDIAHNAKEGHEITLRFEKMEHVEIEIGETWADYMCGNISEEEHVERIAKIKAANP